MEVAAALKQLAMEVEVEAQTLEKVTPIPILEVDHLAEAAAIQIQELDHLKAVITTDL